MYVKKWMVESVFTRLKAKSILEKIEQTTDDIPDPLVLYINEYDPFNRFSFHFPLSDLHPALRVRLGKIRYPLQLQKPPENNGSVFKIIPSEYGSVPPDGRGKKRRRLGAISYVDLVY